MQAPANGGGQRLTRTFVNSDSLITNQSIVLCVDRNFEGFGERAYISVASNIYWIAEAGGGVTDTWTGAVTSASLDDLFRAEMNWY